MSKTAHTVKVGHQHRPVQLNGNFKVGSRMKPYANRLRLRLVHLDLADPKNKKRLEDAWRKMIDLLIKKKIREDVAQQAVAEALDIAADHQLEVLRRDQNLQELKRSKSDLRCLVKQLEVLVHAISRLPPRAKGKLNKIVAAQDWRNFDTEEFGELIHEIIRVLAKSSPACIADTALSAVTEPLRASRHPAVAQIARTAPPATLDLWETIPAETRTQVEAALRAWAAPTRRPAVEFFNHLIFLLEKFRPQSKKGRRRAIEGRYGRRLAKIWQGLGLHVGRAFDGVHDRHVESNFQRFGRLALTAVGDKSRISTRQIEHLKSKLPLRR
ncbi:MAG: hypothetical protein WAU53_19700 [Rhodoplanes sp.]